MNDVVSFLVRTANRVIPKKQNQIVFVSHPDFSDNPRALFDFLLKNKEISKNFQLVWEVADKKVLEQLRNMNINAYLQTSAKGAWEFMRSKYIVTSHGDYINYKAGGQILINLGHGMALKSAGLLDKTEEKEVKKWFLKRWRKGCDGIIATSKIMKHILSSSYWFDPQKVYITGQPRNDKLFTEDGKKNLEKILNMDLSKFEKIVLFAPTFRVWRSRNSTVGNPRENILGFKDFNMETFSSFLKENKILFILRFHPEEEALYYNVELGDNIVLLTSEMIIKNLLTIYDFLNAIDVLITDYSSIYYDFLILDRPMLFVPIDREKYAKEKGGFSVEPYDFWTAGPKVYTFKDFIKELKKCVDDPNYYHEERETINKLTNKYRDANSSARVWELLQKLSKKESVDEFVY